jgi:hypothetical protein
MCLVILAVIYFIMRFLSTTLANHAIAFAPLALGGTVLIAIISLYRNFVLFFLPFIIIDKNGIKNFNAIWYNRHHWDKIDFVNYFMKDQRITLERSTGRILDIIDLNEVNSETCQMIIQSISQRKRLNWIGAIDSFEYRQHMQLQAKLLRQQKQ